MKLEFSRRFSKKSEISNVIKIRVVGAELFHMDGRTDMTKPIVVFRSFANAPENSNNNNTYRHAEINFFSALNTGLRHEGV